MPSLSQHLQLRTLDPVRSRLPLNPHHDEVITSLPFWDDCHTTELFCEPVVRLERYTHTSPKSYVRITLQQGSKEAQGVYSLFVPSRRHYCYRVYTYAMVWSSLIIPVES